MKYAIFPVGIDIGEKGVGKTFIEEKNKGVIVWSMAMNEEKKIRPLTQSYV